MRKTGWVVFVLGVVAAFVAAWNGLHNPFLLDDLTKIVGNTDIRLLANLREKLIYPYHAYQVLQRNDPSRPVVYLLYTLVYAWKELDPFYYHLLSVVVHGIAVGCAYVLAGRWLKDRKWALMVAGLFAWAPMQMGTVMYNYGLSDVLSAMTLLVAVEMYSRAESLTLARLLGSLVFFVFSLGCKQSAVVLPALLILVDYFQRQRWAWRQTLPYWIVALGYLVFRYAYFGGLGDLESYAQSHRVWDYVTCEPWVWVQYLWKAFLPWKLSIDHYLMPFHLSLGERVLGFGILGALFGSLVWLWKRAPVPWVRSVTLGLLWYAICLAPTSSFVPTVDLMVDRRVYLANFGLYFAAAALASRWVVFSKQKWAAGVFALLGLALLTVDWSQNQSAHTAESAWREVLNLYPTSQRGLNSLSAILLGQGKFDEAENIFKETLRLYPNDHVAAENYGSLLGADENPHRDLDRSLQMFQLSGQINPFVAETFYNIGRILQMKNLPNDAVPYYEKTLQLKPSFYPALNNIGTILLAQEKFDEARKYFLEALKLEPSYAPAQKNLDLLNQISLSKKAH